MSAEKYWFGLAFINKSQITLMTTTASRIYQSLVPWICKQGNSSMLFSAIPSISSPLDSIKRQSWLQWQYMEHDEWMQTNDDSERKHAYTTAKLCYARKLQAEKRASWSNLRYQLHSMLIYYWVILRRCTDYIVYMASNQIWQAGGGKKTLPWPKSRHYPSTALQGVRRIMKRLTSYRPSADNALRSSLILICCNHGVYTCNTLSTKFQRPALTETALMFPEKLCLLCSHNGVQWR
jgi:hypothetical protein